MLEVNNNNIAEQSDLVVLKTPALGLVSLVSQLQSSEGGKGRADPPLQVEPGPQKTGNMYKASPRR